MKDNTIGNYSVRTAMLTLISVEFPQLEWSCKPMMEYAEYGLIGERQDATYGYQQRLPATLHAWEIGHLMQQIRNSIHPFDDLDQALDVCARHVDKCIKAKDYNSVTSLLATLFEKASDAS